MHRIHLRGPWQYEWLSGEPAPQSPTGTLKLPTDWNTHFGRLTGRVRLRRMFHRPTNLDPNERVFIIFETNGGLIRFSLNGTALASRFDPASDGRFDVTELLEFSNEILLEVTLGSTADGSQFTGLVVLEIRSDDAAQSLESRSKQ